MTNTMETGSCFRSKDLWNQMGYEEKREAIHGEINRLGRLPGNSTYVIHRLRVLHKVLELLSVQRTSSQEKALELLFAQLSL